MLNQPDWVEALDELLEASKVSAAELARSANISEAAVSYFRARQRRPSADTVFALNAALGQLIKQPEVTQYLDAVYRLDSDDGEGPLPQEAWKTFLTVMAFAFIYLRKDGRQPILTEINALNPKRLRRVVFGANAMWRRRLLRRILGDSEVVKSEYEELRDLCRAQGIDLDRWLLPAFELGELTDRDAFIRDVRNTLRKVQDPAERFDLENEIMSALTKFVASQARRRLQLRDPEFAKEVK